MQASQDYLREKGIKISNILSFNIVDKNTEILDNRDFVVFHKNSGLVVDVDKTLYRVPYIYPFVDPMMRCSIEDPMKFSIQVWQENIDYLEGDPRILSDLSESTIFHILGFPLTTNLKDICVFYRDYLIGINPQIELQSKLTLSANQSFT